MRQLALAGLVAALVVSQANSAARGEAQRPRPPAPPRDKAAVVSGAGEIAGRVTASDTGAPLRHVAISISAAGGGTAKPLSTLTDTNGNYGFGGLPVVRYSVRASKPGFVSLRYGAADPLEPARYVDLAQGNATKIDFKLPRAAVISGDIRDAFGEPLLDAEVRVMRYQNQAGQRRLVTAGRVRLTDDLGAFRIFGLLPGTYYLAVRPREEPTDTPAEGSYTALYYPGTTDVAEARPITVALGSEVSGISFVVTPVQVAQLLGTVADAAGRPAAGAQITAVRREAGNTFITAAETRATADGTFEFKNLAPGSYSVQAWVRGTATSPPEFGAAMAQTAGGEAATVAFRTAPGGTLRGRVVLRSPTGQIPFTPSQMEVIARPASQEVRVPVGRAATARVQRDWTFELRAVSGRRTLRVSGVPAPWALESIQINDRDVTDEPVELTPGDVTSGAEIVLTTTTTEISGVVDRDQSSSPISVIVFPIDRAHWEPYDRRIQVRRASSEGRFRIHGLPPGEYFVVAVPYVWQGEWSDPGFLQTASAVATRVSLAAAGKAATRLKVSPLQQ